MQTKQLALISYSETDQALGDFVTSAKGLSSVACSRIRVQLPCNRQHRRAGALTNHTVQYCHTRYVLANLYSKFTPYSCRCA